jgi:hypothetical protein
MTQTKVFNKIIRIPNALTIWKNERIKPDQEEMIRYYKGEIMSIIFLVSLLRAKRLFSGTHISSSLSLIVHESYSGHSSPYIRTHSNIVNISKEIRRILFQNILVASQEINILRVRCDTSNRNSSILPKKEKRWGPSISPSM